MRCVGCDGPAEGGLLCRDCAREVAPGEGLIRDHIRAATPKEKAAAWLIDGFGRAHPVAVRTTIGREQACGVTVLAPSVSRMHAELRQGDGGWHLRDLGSRNGSFVGAARAEGRIGLEPPVVIRIGDVAMWFVTALPAMPLTTASVPTGSGGRGIQRFWFRAGDVELCLVGRRDPSSGGALLWRAAGGDWSERALAPLEYHLLRVLCARARDEADSPATARGCVATKQLARDLPFQSRYPAEENVRQVVRRLRAALAEVGADGLLAVVPGRGYYLATAVTSVAPPRP